MTTEAEHPSAAAIAEAKKPPRIASMPERIIRLSLLLGAVGGLLFSKIPLCPVAIAFHKPCPGCGLTRATIAAAHLDFAGAYHLHPLVFFATPVVAVWTGSSIVQYLRTGRAVPPQPLLKIAGPVLVLTMVSLFVLWVLRWQGYFGGPVAVG